MKVENDQDVYYSNSIRHKCIYTLEVIGRVGASEVVVEMMGVGSGDELGEGHRAQKEIGTSHPLQNAQQYSSTSKY